MKGKKKIASILACAMLLSAAPVEAMAYTVPDTVRVGLESVCKNVASASIGVWELQIGMQKGDGFQRGGVITSSGLFTARPAVGDYIAVDKTMDCADALDMANDMKKSGLDTYAAYLSGGDWTVYVKDASVSAVEAAADENASRVSFEGVAITGGEAPVLVPENAVMMGGNVADTFKLNSMPYRGMLTFSVNGSSMTGVNIIGLEEYLYGVVPSEMPKSYDAEALKAQAVAARTYAMTKLGAHTGSGYQLCDTTACQVYKGYSNEADATTAAVDATAGEVACYNGSPIEAVFSASTGGYTESSENVWNTAVPYLKSVDSPEGDEVPNYHSQVVLSSQQVQEAALAAYPGADLSGEPSSWFGQAVRDEGGTVTSIPFGGLTLTGGQVRSMLSLRSAAFTVTWDGENFTFDVTGYGHGVGMSQYGANTMAREGKSFRDILTWYYTGTQVELLW